MGAEGAALISFRPHDPGTTVRIHPQIDLRPMTRTRLVLPLASLLLLVLTAVRPASAQSLDLNQAEWWQLAFGHQIATLLESPDPNLQAQGLQVFITVADRNDPTVALRPATDALLNVYATSPRISHRMMAIAALSKIDDRKAYASLLDTAMGELDNNVRRMVLYAASASRSVRAPAVATAYNALLHRDREILLSQQQNADTTQGS